MGNTFVPIRYNSFFSMTIRGIQNVVRVIGVPVGSLVGIGGLYKMMMSSSSSSSSFDDNDDKVVVEGVDANTGGMSRRLQTRSDFDQYIAQFKSPATRRKNNMNHNNNAVIVNVNVESPVESPVECNGIMETKLYRDLHTQRKIARALNRDDDETEERREPKSNDELKWKVTIDE